MWLTAEERTISPHRLHNSRGSRPARILRKMKGRRYTEDIRQTIDRRYKVEGIQKMKNRRYTDGKRQKIGVK